MDETLYIDFSFRGAVGLQPHGWNAQSTARGRFFPPAWMVDVPYVSSNCKQAVCSTFRSPASGDQGDSRVK